jgi:DNA gyrase/topoisomerase IV subunit A
MRLVLKLVLGSNPEETLQRFYELTRMQTSFAVRMLARVDGRERVLTLRDLISEWVTARLRDRPPEAVRRELREVAERHGDERRTTSQCDRRRDTGPAYSRRQSPAECRDG